MGNSEGVMKCPYCRDTLYVHTGVWDNEYISKYQCDCGFSYPYMWATCDDMTDDDYRDKAIDESIADAERFAEKYNIELAALFERLGG